MENLNLSSFPISFCAASIVKTAFEKLEKYILRLSTPAAAVAVCTGLIMKKFCGVEILYPSDKNAREVKVSKFWVKKLVSKMKSVWVYLL